MDDRLTRPTESAPAAASPTAPDRTGARDTEPERTSPEGLGLTMAPLPGYGSRTEAISAAAAQISMAPSSRTDVLHVSNGSSTRTAASRVDFNGTNGHHAVTPAVPTSSAPPALPTPDAIALLKALRHRWLMAVSAGLVCAVAASAMTWFFLPATLNLVTASSLLYMKQADTRRPLWVVGERTDWGTFKRTQCDLLRTRTVLEEALHSEQAASLGVAKMHNAVEWLESKIKVDDRGNSELVEVSMTGEKPAQVTILVNAVVQSYLKNYVDTERDRKQELLQEYLQFKQKLDEQIKAKLQQVHAQKKLYPGDKPVDLNQMMELNNFQRAQAEFMDVSNRLYRAGLRLTFLEQQKKKPAKAGATAVEIPRHLIEEELEKDASTTELRKSRAMLQSRIEGYKRFAAEGAARSGMVAASLKGYESDLERVNRELKKREDELRPRILAKLQSSMPAASGSGDSSLERLQEEIAQLKEERKYAEEQWEKSKNEVQKFYGRSSAEMEQLVKDIEGQQEMAKQFALEIEALNLELRNPPRVRLVQEAIEPQPRDPHRQSKTIFLAGFSAFLFVGFCTAWIEFRSQRLHAADEVVQGLGLRLLGTVPALPNRVRHHPLEMETLQDSRLHNLVTESFDGIRTMILHEARQSPLRVLMVASGVSGEGKTTLSSHLAASLAHAGYKTLLIDCDLVHPTLHQLFDLPLTPGVCEVLRGQVDYHSAVLPTAAPGLSLLPAGEYDRQVSQVLAKGWIQNLFDTLRAEYEFIIIDTCPVLSVANTMLIGQHVDGVILSILRDKSQAPKVHATYQRLATLGIRILGTVFSKARNDVYGYYGYYRESNNHYNNGTAEQTAIQ